MVSPLEKYYDKFATKLKTNLHPDIYQNQQIISLFY